MATHGRDIIARAVQKRDKARVALKKTACGAVLIDGMPFSISVESDGAKSNKGMVFTLSGEAVNDGRVTLDMLDVTYPTSGGTKSIKRKPEFFKKSDGKHVYRAHFTEIKIPECADSSPFSLGTLTEEQLLGSVSSQIIFKFVPHFSGADEPELMINIYPLENPLDGNCVEWKNVTADRDFFEHGGLARIAKK